MSDFDTRAIIDLLQNSFLPENSQGMDISLQLELAGETEEQWYLLIKEQKCLIESGVFPNSRVQLSVAKKDLLRLISGELDPMVAFFTGKVHVRGDRNVLMKIPSVFSFDPAELKKYL